VRKFLIALIFIMISTVSFAQVNPNYTYVHGYTKSNGTYVKGYYRTVSNNTNRDNYSTRGNINPWTGERGTVEPDHKSYSKEATSLEVWNAWKIAYDKLKSENEELKLKIQNYENLNDGLVKLVDTYQASYIRAISDKETRYGGIIFISFLLLSILGNIILGIKIFKIKMGTRLF